MTRWVKKMAGQPKAVDVTGKKTINVCACGLTSDPNGLCDGSHAVVGDEEKGKIYIYDKNLGRKEIGKRDDHGDNDACSGCC